MENQGWIKIHRKLLESSIAGKPTIAWLFVVLLLKANHKENKFLFNKEEITIKAGQLLTGIKELSSQAHLTISQTRYALNCLKVANTLAIKSTNKFSVITILNYEQYQYFSKQSNKPVTNQQQTSNKPVTTNNNDKNVKNDNKQYIEFVSFWNFIFKREYKPIEALLPNFNYWVGIYSLDEIKKAVMVAHTDKFWADKIKPVTLLRRKSPQGEAVDYIGGFINKERKFKKLGGDFNG